jgi:hypothetical protein
MARTETPAAELGALAPDFFPPEPQWPSVGCSIKWRD